MTLGKQASGELGSDQDTYNKVITSIDEGGIVSPWPPNSGFKKRSFFSGSSRVFVESARVTGDQPHQVGHISFKINLLVS